MSDKTKGEREAIKKRENIVSWAKIKPYEAWSALA